MKRSLELSEISALEDPAGKGAECERSMVLKFFEKDKGDKVARRTILFVSKRQKDAFVEQVRVLPPPPSLSRNLQSRVSKQCI